MESSGYIINNGTRIYYEIIGSGKPLLFIHGNGEDIGCFDNQLELCKEFKVIRMDSRGHGSSVYEGPLSLSLMATDVLKLLDYLEITKANIIGFSDGGNIALHMALMAPERINQMMIVGANLYPFGIKFKYLMEIYLVNFFYSFMGIFKQKYRQKYNVWSLMVNEPNFSLEEIESIKTYVHVVAGSYDMIKDKHTRLIANTLSNSELTIIDNCNHFVFQTKPNEINNLIREYFK